MEERKTKNKVTATLLSMLILGLFVVPNVLLTSATPSSGYVWIDRNKNGINDFGDFNTTTITWAVGNASTGDIIYVESGTYAGAIVDKNVTVSGASGGETIITSGVLYKVGGSLYTAFRLDANADGAEIRNFTINCNSSESFYFAIFSRNADDVTVDSLTVNDAVQGITNWGGSNWEITNNVLNNTEAAGGGGIAIWLGAYPPDYPVCSGNLVQNNTITATATAPDYTCPGIGVGLDLRWDAYDSLTGSEDISGNQILNNNITAPGALNGVGIEMGVLGLEGNATKIAAVLGTIHDNTIRGNTIEGADFGVYFYTVSNLEISENEIKNCNEGIHIKDGSSGNTINYNNIFGNAIGLNNTATESVDARFNWWGDPWGPTASPPAGDKISGNVDYKPWLIEPYPPAVVVPKLYVDPPTTDLLSPQWQECMNFSVEIPIENVTDLYGFEFKLKWNSTLIDLVGIHTKLDGLWTDYWTAYNETWEEDDTGWYWLAAAAKAPAASFNGTAPLVNLLFHIKYVPCYPVVCTTLLNLTDVKLSDSKADPIPVWIEDGTYTIGASKPKLKMTPATKTSKRLGETFEVEVWLLNATKVYDYAFKINYNTTILDAINVVIDPVFLPGPYQTMYTKINETEGWVYVELEETSSGPPANGDGLLVTITFNVTKAVIWKKCQNNTLYSSINFTEWKISVKCPTPRNLEEDLVDINNAEYWFIPMPGDVNSDGNVNVIDLRMVARNWDTSEPTVDLNCDGTIDIYDLVLVTKHYGEDC